jgi:hypothetical protein
VLYAQYLSTSFIYLFVIAIRVKDKYLRSSKPSCVLRSKLKSDYAANIYRIMFNYLFYKYEGHYCD